MLITGQGKTYAFTFETNGDGYIAEPYISYKNLGNNIIFQSSGVAISPQLSYNYNFQMAIQGVVTEILSHTVVIILVEWICMII